MRKKYFIDKKRYEAVKKRLKENRYVISDKIIAEAAGVTERTIQGYVEKNPKQISAERLEDIAYFLGVSAAWLAGEEDNRFDENGERIEIYERSPRDYLTDYLIKKGYIEICRDFYLMHGKDYVINGREKDTDYAVGYIALDAYIKSVEKAIECATSQFVTTSIYCSQDRRYRGLD